jgi:predicted HAD superfamily phosphohydrolase YqeG
LLARAAKGAGDFLMYQKVYQPIAANIVGDNLAADIVAGGVQGIGKAAINSLSHEGLTLANNML